MALRKRLTQQLYRICYSWIHGLSWVIHGLSWAYCLFSDNYSQSPAWLFQTESAEFLLQLIFIISAHLFALGIAICLLSDFSSCYSRNNLLIRRSMLRRAPRACSSVRRLQNIQIWCQTQKKYVAQFWILNSNTNNNAHHATSIESKFTLRGHDFHTLPPILN